MTRSADADADGRPRPRPRTDGQRRRFRRNVVIAAAHHAGVSQRLLADVFGLPRSHVAAILKELGAYGGPASP